MKTPAHSALTTRARTTFLVALGCSVALSLHAQDSTVSIGPAWGAGWPGGSQNAPQRPAIGRVDLDADMNYDGVISNDESDSGDLEANAPGLIIGPSLLAKFIFRVTPFGKMSSNSKTETSTIPLDKLMTSLEVRQINPTRADGLFLRDPKDAAKAGHVKVWSDAQCSKLLLDSADPAKCRMEWPLNAKEAIGTVYVQSVKPAEQGSLLVLVLETDDSSRTGYAIKKYSPTAARDYVLVTTKAESMKVERDEEAKPGKSTPGYGVYWNFSKTDRDSKDTWVPVPAGH